MTITVSGSAAFAAERRVSFPDQQQNVVVLLDAGPGYRFEARLPFGQDVARAEAVALAARRGALVVVEAEGAFPRTDHGYAAIVLTRVTRCHIDGAAVYP